MSQIRVQLPLNAATNKSLSCYQFSIGNCISIKTISDKHIEAGDRKEKNASPVFLNHIIYHLQEFFL